MISKKLTSKDKEHIFRGLIKEAEQRGYAKGILEESRGCFEHRDKEVREARLATLKEVEELIKRVWNNTEIREMEGVKYEKGYDEKCRIMLLKALANLKRIKYK